MYNAYSTHHGVYGSTNGFISHRPSQREMVISWNLNI